MVKLEANKEKAISFNLTLHSDLRYSLATIEKNGLKLTGKAPVYVASRSYDPDQIIYDPHKGMNFEVQTRILTDGGEMQQNDTTLMVQQANEVIILLSAATSYQGIDKEPGTEGKDASAETSRSMNEALKKGYQTIVERHLHDYQSLFNRVELSLGKYNASKDSLPTNKRLEAFAGDDADQGIVELYYQYGRYLAIASSRTGGVPSNLQGIWNRHVQPPWGSNYTVNINTQMNYWPVETTHLQECFPPLSDLIANLARNGKKQPGSTIT